MEITSLTYAGHSSLLVHCDSLEAAIDPWLQGNPLCPEALYKPGALDLIVLTHGHADHAGDAVRLAKAYGAQLAATYELAMLLINEGVPEANLIPMNKGGTVNFKGLQITLTNAFHSSSYDTSSGSVYAGEPCGVVLRDNKTSLYHAGDTCLFSDMQLIRSLYKPDIALLPIGDRFTMGPEEAAQAAEIIAAKYTIPIHYNTFELLTGTAKQFQEACSSVTTNVLVLEPGKNWQVPQQ